MNTSIIANEPTRKIGEVTLDCGELVYVEPVSPFIRNQIREQSFELYPLPDQASYEVPMVNAFVEGTMLPAHENPDYLKAVEEAKKKQVNYINLSTMLTSVIDTPDGREVTLARYAEMLTERRRFSKLPENNWHALVLAVLVTTQTDINNILLVAQDVIKEGEVRQALRSFRIPVREIYPHRNHRGTTPPGTLQPENPAS